jgi:type II secretory pathway pseudopilin PulG
MQALARRTIRRALTLVELLVVVALLVLIAALGAAFLPRFQDSQHLTRGVDLLTQWLLTAKQRAKRDGLPTGVRILFDSSTSLADQLEYIQQPEPLTGGTLSGIASGTATFTGVDFVGAATSAGQADIGLVEPGDYLEVYGGGTVHLISAVGNATTLTLSNTSLTLTLPSTGATNYRILRQPHRLASEGLLQLPQDIVIDNNPNPDNSNSPYSQNVPQRQVGSSTFYEILFSPSGAVIGKGTASGKIILWVLNTAADISDPASSALIAVQVRTGFIAAHPVASGSDPYQFTEDGRSSGL